MIIVAMGFSLFGLNLSWYSYRAYKKHDNEEKSDTIDCNDPQTTLRPENLCPTYYFDEGMNHTEINLQSKISRIQRKRFLRSSKRPEFVYQFHPNLNWTMDNYGLNWKNSRDVFLYTKKLYDYLPNGILDASALKVDGPLDGSFCKVNKTQSCVENYEFGVFNNDLINSTNYFILRVHWNVTDSQFIKTFFSQHPQPDAVYSLELSNTCSEFMNTLFT